MFNCKSTRGKYPLRCSTRPTGRWGDDAAEMDFAKEKIKLVCPDTIQSAPSQLLMGYREFAKSHVSLLTDEYAWNTSMTRLEFEKLVDEIDNKYFVNELPRMKSIMNSYDKTDRYARLVCCYSTFVSKK